MRFLLHKNFISTLIVASMISYFVLFSAGSIFGQPTIAEPLYTSTRHFFDTNTDTLLHSGLSPEPLASSLFNQEANNCPSEIAIYVHGVWASEDSAKEQTERVGLSLASLNNTITLIGYTWDSNTPFDPEDPSISQEGWKIAKIIAKENGPLLAKFIIDFKETCPNSEIRIMAHSLGSRVVLSALDYLFNHQNDFNMNNQTSKIIKAVHLMGAAVDNEEVSLNSIVGFNNPFPWFAIPSCTIDDSGVKFAYGKSIQNIVEDFYNFVNSEDNVLQRFYPCAEGGNDALGQSGKDDDNSVQTPANYHDIKGIEAEIKPGLDADADGEADFGLCLSSPFFSACDRDEGDNHAGYMGYRDILHENAIDDDGVIDLVVQSWQS
jgi:hypothetical protein